MIIKLIDQLLINPVLLAAEVNIVLLGIILFIIVVYLTIRYIKFQDRSQKNNHKNIGDKASRRAPQSEQNIDRDTLVQPSDIVQEPRKNAQRRKKKPLPNQLHLNLDLEITYVNAAGDKTIRNITVNTYSKTTKKIHAWCHLRNEQRTFFTNRMIEVIDTSTGECVEDIDALLLKAANNR